MNQRKANESKGESNTYTFKERVRGQGIKHTFENQINCQRKTKSSDGEKHKRGKKKGRELIRRMNESEGENETCTHLFESHIKNQRRVNDSEGENCTCAHTW